MTEMISQREMRNRSGEVLRAVAAGESFIITNDGVPVATLTPLTEQHSKPPVTRPATRRGPIPMPTHVPSVPTRVILDDLKGDR